MATSGSRSSGQFGIMSWTADPGASQYAVRIRAEDDTSGKIIFKKIDPGADDTRDGTMDIAVSKYVTTPGAYQWMYKTHDGSSWSRYSDWQDVDHGGEVSTTIDRDPSIMVIGDSFTVPGRGFPAALDGVLDRLGYDIDVIAFSKSGNTSAQSLDRLEGYFASSANKVPDMALIALGINDALQELAPSTTKQALGGIIDLFSAHDIEILLTQPDAYYPNHPSSSKGFETPAEQDAFHRLFEELADAHDDVSLARGFLDGLDVPGRLESDNFHPNEAGTSVMAQNIASELNQLVLDYQADLQVG